MELGNIIFGNSRGEYEIPRGCGWEDEMFRLFHAVDPDYDGYHGFEFENDVFSLFPYYWGECTCGYDERVYNWEENNSHRPDCYQHEYANAEKNKNGLFVSRDILREIYKKYGWETESEKWDYGCAVRCSCDYSDRWCEFLKNNDHDMNCPIIKPNFLYKPTGFEIQWYKYPLRDSYMNQKITLSEFTEIINNCILNK